MLWSVKARNRSFLQHVQYQVSVCKSFLSSTAFWYKNEECTLQIKSRDDIWCIVWVYIWNKLGFKSLYFGSFRPAFEGKIKSSRSQIWSSDTDLTYCLELLSSGTLYGTVSDSGRERFDLFVLFLIESAFFFFVGPDFFIQDVASCKVMEDKSLLPCVHYFASENSLIFLNKLHLVCKLLVIFDDFSIYRHCRPVIFQATA